MATAAEIQTAYKAIYRTDLNVTVAQAIAASGISLDAYIAQQLPQVASTTQAAVAIASFVTGTVPTSARVDALKVEADKQVASYTALGVGNPSLGAYEAFGRSFATDASTTAGFNTKYGALSTADFIAVVYAQVYGTQPTAAAAANLTAQITYFTNLYTANNVPNAALAAKGAVLGQIVGYAFTSPASANSVLDNQVTTLLTSAAKGDTTVYNKALPTVVDPGQVGVNITVAAGDVVGLNVANPALKSTNFNDTITGVVSSTSNIDAAAGDDTATLSYDGNAAADLTPTIKGVETLYLNEATAGTKVFSLANVTGVTTVGFKDSVALGEVTGLAAGVNVAVIDTDATSDTLGATFSLKDATGTSDVVSLTVNGVASAGRPVITIADVETINLNSTGVASKFELTAAAAKTLNISATKAVDVLLTAASSIVDTIKISGAGDVTVDNGAANKVVTLDGAAATGKITFVADTTTTTITTGSGADSVTSITKSGAVVNTGAGNDTIGFNLAGANDTATVTGGTGGDAITLTGGKITVVYTGQADSTNANFDTLTGFTTGSDKIDLKALALGTQTAINTFNSATPLANGVDYFGGKAVAFGTDSLGDQYLLVDVNKSGVFDVNADMIVKIAAGGTVAFADIVFA